MTDLIRIVGREHKLPWLYFHVYTTQYSFTIVGRIWIFEWSLRINHPKIS